MYIYIYILCVYTMYLPSFPPSPFLSSLYIYFLYVLRVIGVGVGWLVGWLVFCGRVGWFVFGGWVCWVVWAVGFVRELGWAVGWRTFVQSFPPCFYDLSHLFSTFGVTNRIANRVSFSHRIAICRLAGGPGYIYICVYIMCVYNVPSFLIPFLSCT